MTTKTAKITASCNLCDASETFRDPTLVKPWLDAHHCPAQVVELPETPTLGWAKWGAHQYLAVFETRGDNLRAVDSDGEMGGDKDTVGAFTEATAIPTAALDVFRHLRETRNLTNKHVDNFLAAIDEANGLHA